ncbi:MAG: F0F1 ATP synthase subunit delta [Tissierellia bacterium]|nr:F0F1 ATP synthase subunit delta [Tissierellia bacterium]
MSNKVAKRYGYALYRVAMEEGKGEAFLQEVSQAHEVLKEEDRLRVFTHPDISPKDKKDLLARIFQDSLSREVLNFLYVLIDKKRLNILGDILEVYRDLVYEEEAIEQIEIRSAIDLSQEKIHDLVRAYAPHKRPDQLVIKTQVDPDLIGGLVIQVGNQVLDLSILGQLKALEKQMKQV